MKALQNWEVILMVARDTNSERLFLQALEIAERHHGCQSPQVGLCLIDFSTCLEQKGKTLEAEQTTNRYRAILQRIALEMGFQDRTVGPAEV
ncbi:MAG: tetratricopeptide repeat protein [Candidatus Obscuribacterales bacterium]|nr:tetratricopeptide repeat protein [Candidatus Obscuribacterales bacterium]